MPEKIKVGISQGDPNGISYEVIIKSLRDSRIYELFTPIVYGSAKLAAYHRKALKIDNFNFNQISKAAEAHPKRANILNCGPNTTTVELGQKTEQAGEASFLALEKATEDLKENRIDALVTAPINKDNIQSENFNFQGHTEYLEDRFEGNSLMFMVTPELKVGFATNHVPLDEVVDNLRIDTIIEKLKIMDASLKIDFNISVPKIAVLGLNPHAGDNGLIGNHEDITVSPAIEEAKKQGILCFGPFAADGFFGSGAYQKYDAVLAMYHDQGMIPFKLLSMEQGVNYTAGLSVVRTSPAHGTAFELAGKGEASHQSMLQALFLAVDIVKNRKFNEED